MFLPHGISGKRSVRVGKLGLAGLAILALASAGCAWTRPQVVYHRSGELTSYKRYERHAERDFIHHFTRPAYRPPRFGVSTDHADQKTIVDLWGQPDYRRKAFQSLQGERVEEWLYLDNQRIFQFVRGEMIFDGPLTDLEQVLLRYGYPDRGTMTISEFGTVKHTLLYNRVFGPFRMETFHLANDWIVHSSEGD